MGGTLTVQLGVMLPTSVRSACRVGTGRGGAAGWCTLLGPEGPGFLLTRECWWGLGLTGPSLGQGEPTVVVGECWCRSYVENYTVDASIFEITRDDDHLRVVVVDESIAILIFVVKFLRANGGCLGIWSRRRT